MSDRPTPETDDIARGNHVVPTEWAQQLERERDEARRKLNNLDVTAIHSCHNECQRPICVLRRERDDAREKAERYRREANKFMLQRDEAKDKYATEATEHMLAVNKLCNERDEAQADCLEQARLLGMGSEREARLISQRDDALSQIAQAECRAERFCQERDDARIDAQKSKAYKRVLKETNLRQTERIRYLEGATNHACGTPLSVALRERDEARDALMKIEDLFIDGTDIYADRENMGLIARSALEETK